MRRLEIKEIEIDRIKPDKEQPRKTFDIGDLKELAESLKSGSQQIAPIAIDENNTIIVGERRWRAAKLAGLKKIACVVRSVPSKLERLKIQADEDVHDKTIPLEERDKFWYKIYKEGGFKTARELAAFLNVNEKSVNDCFDRLEFKKIVGRELDVSPSVISETQSLPIKERIQLIKTAEKKDIGGRKIREYVTTIKKYSDKPDIKERLLKGEIEPGEISKLEQAGEELLQLPFRLEHSKMVLNEIKTQTSRFRLNGIREGDIVQANIYEPNFAKLKVSKIERKKLGDFTEKDAEREGGYTLEKFKKVWQDIHGEWNPETVVNVVHFKVIKNERKAFSSGKSSSGG